MPPETQRWSHLALQHWLIEFWSFKERSREGGAWRYQCVESYEAVGMEVMAGQWKLRQRAEEWASARQKVSIQSLVISFLKPNVSV